MDTPKKDIEATTPLQEATKNGRSDEKQRSKQQQHKKPKPGTKKSSPKPTENLDEGKPKAKTTTTTILDEKLPEGIISKDPRGEGEQRIKPKSRKKKGGGRNTESFDPASTLVRPALRVQIGSANIPRFNKILKHDDVVIVPELFGPEDDWKLYYQLVQEVTELQSQKVTGSEWISWHEGAHLIVKQPPNKSVTFNKIIDRLCEYFGIQRKSVGTRFNWYKDSGDWKPFHHDSAAFNPNRAKNQNITVGVSFGATRELAFLRANDDSDCRIYFPQTNNGVFTFGRDVNIHWKHGINALPEDEHNGKGRISIILWGLVDAVEEEGSPPLLGSDGKGPHAATKHNKYNKNNRRRPRRNNNKNNNNKQNQNSEEKS